MQVSLSICYFSNKVLEDWGIPLLRTPQDFQEDCFEHRANLVFGSLMQVSLSICYFTNKVLEDCCIPLLRTPQDFQEDCFKHGDK